MLDRCRKKPGFAAAPSDEPHGLSANSLWSRTKSSTIFLICALTCCRLWVANGFLSPMIPKRRQSLPLFGRRKELCSLSSRLWMHDTEVGNLNHTDMYAASTTSATDFEVEATSSSSPGINGNHDGNRTPPQNGAPPPPSSIRANGFASSQSSLPDWLQEKVDQTKKNPNLDVPRPTENGGYSHTAASKAKISAANKGKTPWNKGKGRSEEVKARIAAGVRKRNRERFLEKLKGMGITEEEYNAQLNKEKAAKEAEKKARRTEKGGYRPTEETKQKISQILKTKWANGEVKKRSVDPSKVRRGFKHSEETRAKISASLKKRWATDKDYRDHMMNKTVTANSRDDVRQRISATLKERWEDPEFRANMTAKIATRKRPTNSHGPSHREKISATMKAKWKDKAYRKRATEAMARRQAELAMTRSPRIKNPKFARKTASKQANISGSTSELVLVNGAEAVAKGSGPRLAQPLSRPKKKLKGVRKRAETTTAAADLLRPKMVAPVKKKKAVKEKKVNLVVGPVASSPTGLEVMPKPKAKTQKEAPGSLTRLREERRDLYDLLYGDDDENDPAKDRGRVLPSGSDKSRLSSVFLDDENLDDFDPYGLEDF